MRSGRNLVDVLDHFRQVAGKLVKLLVVIFSQRVPIGIRLAPADSPRDPAYIFSRSLSAGIRPGIDRLLSEVKLATWFS